MSLTDLLPPLQQCAGVTLQEGDVVVHAPGFEDRTMAIVGAFTPKIGTPAILLDYLPFNPRNRLADVREGLLARGIELADGNILQYDRFNPGDFEARLQASLRVLVDGI